MRKPTAQVAASHIIEFLRARPGKEYTINQLAAQFRTSATSVGQMYRNLPEDGWKVEKSRFAGTTYFRVWPPQPTETEHE